MPFDGNNWNWDKKVSFKEIMDITHAEFGENNISKIQDKPNDTSRSFELKNALGTFGIISSVTNPFCDTCNRIRLTADGKIKNCLFSNDETDILTALRNNQPIEHLIFNSISNKKKSRSGIVVFDNDTVKELKNRNMTSIGG
jgi:cyclic pyranopterin phosphate synthase